MLENNARVDVFNLEGKSSLHLASESGSLEVSEALLERNAYVNSKTKTAIVVPMHMLLFTLGIAMLSNITKHIIRNHNPPPLSCIYLPFSVLVL